MSQFVYGSNSNVPDYVVRGGAKYRIVTDQLGSVRLVINVATGAVAQTLRHDAWGNVVSETGTGFVPFGFAGGLYDADTGLVRFGARDYDPVVGRWVSKDPILFFGNQANLYVYLEDNPIDAIDPSGRSMCDACIVAVAAWSSYCTWLALGTGPGAVATLPICAVGAAALAVHNCLPVCESTGDLDPPAPDDGGDCSQPDDGNSSTGIGPDGGPLP